jgi:hypothetical protein
MVILGNTSESTVEFALCGSICQQPILFPSFNLAHNLSHNNGTRKQREKLIPLKNPHKGINLDKFITEA